VIKADASDFGHLAAAARGAEKDVQKAVRKALRETAKPLGASVVRAGSAVMPARGGLRAKLSGGKVGFAASFGKNPSVMLKLGAKPGVGLATLNRGTLRHPVYGRSKWVSQRVPVGTYSAAFEKGAPLVRLHVAKAMDEVLNDIAKKV
jgi:hypothetical protein